ncbi:class I SAM-dependent methyltransferase [Inmirania thermothiophila]|uniref:Methyltransferase family protein n=1 Tax=Inmirania thermothiophila TaxID=1750597 RepID=A0A3N1Y7Y4_9GAMM|nr:class I SAM-dependent methyltransferase [Inmirania thermothiophila]ROR34885.1 methyltransferase family protein [Inmirania thermothiophila]
MAAFSDHFGPGAAAYAAARPGYPPALFDLLARRAPGRALAVDCGAGSGQASLGLAGRFARVVAVEPSAGQIARARRHPALRWVRAAAEALPLADGVADLLAAAQAAHWFEPRRFHAEVRRVLRPGGLVALWCYGRPTVSPEVDRVLGRYYHEVVGPFWPPERRHVETAYRELPFPYRPLAAPALAMEARWDCARMRTYLASWSASARYRAHHGSDPLREVGEALAEAWGGGLRTVRWPLNLRLGRVAAC